MNNELTIESLRQIKKLLEREPTTDEKYLGFEDLMLFHSKNSKKLEKTIKEKIEISKRLVKKWERSE